jgi:hypothetical protein
VALLLGRSASRAREATQAPHFPAPVANVSGQRAWVVDDIVSYAAGQPFPTREPGELQHLIFDSRDVQQRSGLSGDSLRTAINKKDYHLLPAPAGQVSQCHYWLRADVDEFSWPKRRQSRRISR